MEPYEEINQASGSDAPGLWEDMCRDCRGTQLRVLRGILEHAAGSEFGRAHGLTPDMTLDGYRAAVPVSEYGDIEDMVERIADTAAKDVLYEGETVFFTSTSGTTGKNKRIPESARGTDAKNAVVRLRTLYLNGSFAEAARRSDKIPRLMAAKGVDPRVQGTDISTVFHYFPLASSIPNTRTKGGIEVGYASGRTMDTGTTPNGMAFPALINGLPDEESVMYLSMMFALRHDDVVTVAGNNAGRLLSRIEYAKANAERMIRDIRNGTIDGDVRLSTEDRSALEGMITADPGRADELQKLLDTGRDDFVPRNYWPYLLSAGFWLSGSVGMNVDRIRPMLGDVLFFDVGYGASEAKMNIPMRPDTGHGPLAICSAFYEFRPVGCDRILTADELEDGGEYEILLTTYSGLYRYDIHDIVRVRGFTGDTPDIEFVTKSREILNIAQEKVPAPALLESVASHLASNGVTVRQAQVWPDEKERTYRIYVEPDGCSAEELLTAAGGLDERISGDFPMYARNRNLGALCAPVVVPMRRGWQDALFRSKAGAGTPTSQIKLDALARERPGDEWTE